MVTRISVGGSIVLSLFMIACNAQAESPNPLIGSWQGTLPESQAGPASVITNTFNPDGTFESIMAVAPRPGQASGTSVASGTYKLTGPGSVVTVTQSSMLCTSGGCGPSPMPWSNEPMESTFEMRGPNKYLSAGTIMHRVR
jgi:hypothetical protein